MPAFDFHTAKLLHTMFGNMPYEHRPRATRAIAVPNAGPGLYVADADGMRAAARVVRRLERRGFYTDSCGLPDSHYLTLTPAGTELLDEYKRRSLMLGVTDSLPGVVPYHAAASLCQFFTTASKACAVTGIDMAKPTFDALRVRIDQGAIGTYLVFDGADGSELRIGLNCIEEVPAGARRVIAAALLHGIGPA